MVAPISTDRLVLRQWSTQDASAALSIYGTDAVSTWLTPWVAHIGDPDEMRSTIQRWLIHDDYTEQPAGHWALETRTGGTLIGGLALAYVPKRGDNLTIRWELDPARWGHGYAAEAVDALLHWAMHEVGVIEVFALVQMQNARASATAQRVGMEPVRDIGTHLRVFRARDGLLGSPEPLDWRVSDDAR